MIFILVGLMTTTAYPDPITIGCGPDAHVVVQAVHDAYLDPSDENRAHVSDEFIEKVLVPMRSMSKILDMRAVQCLGDLLDVVSPYADREKLNAALFDQSVLYAEMWRQANREHGATSPEAGSIMGAGGQLAHSASVRASVYLTDSSRKASLKRARAACLSAAGKCEAWSAAALVFAGDESSERLLREHPPSDPSTREALARWSKTLRQQRDPIEAARAILAEPSVAGDPASGLLLEWATDSLLVGPDPRSWDPRAVAILIEAARRFDREGNSVIAKYSPPVVVEKGYRRVSPPPSPVEMRRQENVRFILGRLKPLGLRRIGALVELRNVAVSGIGMGERSPVVDGDAQHFWGELGLYKQEWRSRNPEPASYPERASDGYRAAKYAEQRWNETDAQAPSPDIVAIRKELLLLESRPIGGKE